MKRTAEIDGDLRATSQNSSKPLIAIAAVSAEEWESKFSCRFLIQNLLPRIDGIDYLIGIKIGPSLDKLFNILMKDT